MQGVNNFLNIPLGTAVSFSYDFTVLQAGQTVSNVQTKSITIPGSEQTIIEGRNRQPMTTQIPEETLTVPINVPADMVPLILPDDFNQTINNQFCFVLQNSSGNYSLNVRGLNQNDISNTKLGNGSSIAFMNVTQSIKQNAWYSVTESMSGNGIAAYLYNKNGTLMESMETPYNATNSNEMVMLITNNADSAVILKDLTVKALNNVTQPPEGNEKTTNSNDWLFPCITLAILLVATFSVAAVYVKKRRHVREKKTGKKNETKKIIFRSSIFYSLSFYAKNAKRLSIKATLFEE